MRLVVITGASRSGSTFFCELLKGARNLAAGHERVGGRDLFCVSSYDAAHPYVRRELAKGVARAKAAGAWQCVVEVNSNLCFSVEELKALAPDAQIFHLARSGREVVASNWRRKMYTRWAKGVDVRPQTDAGLEVFERYDRFQKLCWQWTRIVSGLEGEQVPLIRLEDAVSDYGYLDRTLLTPAGIDLPKAAWDRIRADRVNGSRVRLGNIFRGRTAPLIWTDRREVQFRALCGASMRSLGYDLPVIEQARPALPVFASIEAAVG